MGINLYDKNGYLNWKKIMQISKHCFMCTVTGNRGCGKTFGCLDYVYHTGKPFLYLRRTKTQFELSCKDETHPFKALEAAGRVEPLTVKAVAKDLTGLYHYEEDEKGKRLPVGAAIGYMSAISTFSNLRGMSFEEIEYIIIDEFIPEPHERPIKNEAQAILNMIETVNRNRELQGREPVKVILMSNANDIACPLFIELDLVKKCEQMMQKKQEVSIDENRGLCMIHLSFSPISEMKKHTALYKLTAKSSKEFNAMALDNRYWMDDSVMIRPEPITEFTPYVTVANVSIYRHKSERRYYVTQFKTGTCREYGTSAAEKERFINNYYFLWDSFLNNRVYFENYLAFTLFQNAFDTTK